MSGRTRLALCAFAATLLAAGSLLPLVETADWVPQAAFLLALQGGVGVLARRMGLARILTVSLQVLVTLLAVTVVFAGEHALFGVLPGPQAVQGLAELLSAGAEDVNTYSIRAPETDGIRLMLVGGVLLVGLVVDVLAVTLRAAAPRVCRCSPSTRSRPGSPTAGPAGSGSCSRRAVSCFCCWPRAGTGCPGGAGCSAVCPIRRAG